MILAFKTLCVFINVDSTSSYLLFNIKADVRYTVHVNKYSIRNVFGLQNQLYTLYTQKLKL